MGNRPSNNLFFRHSHVAVYGTSELNQMAFTVIQLRQLKFNIKQNILLDGCYLLFEEFCKKNISLYPELCRKTGQSLEELVLNE